MLAAIRKQSTQSTISATSRRPIGATEPGPFIGKPNRLPG
jgi:hypothetical protein